MGSDFPGLLALLWIPWGLGEGQSGQVLEQGDQIWQLYGAGLEGKEENQKPPAVVPEGTPSLTPGAGGGECWGSRHSRKV